MVQFKLWDDNHPLILHNVNMVLKVSSVSTNIIFNEYDAAETNGVLTTAHDKAKQAVKLCKFHNCFA